MKTVNKLDYLYRKLVLKAREQQNETVDITDEEYAKHYKVESEPIEPTPGSDIPIPGEEDLDHDYSQDYLTFEALEDGTFSFTINDLFYSTNNGASWKSLAAGTETELITKGTKVLWKRDSNLNTSRYYTNWFYIGIFSSTGQFNVSGNILSLFYISNFNNFNSLPIYGNLICYRMFSECIGLINAKNLILPTQLSSRCFDSLFYDCLNLTEVPELPSTTLEYYCYSDMFNGCKNLLKAPELLAVTLKDNCYHAMFYGCEKINKIKMLASNISSYNSIYNWLDGVSPTGTFIKNSKATFDIGPSGIPAGWEIIDEEVPEEGE